MFDELIEILQKELEKTTQKKLAERVGVSRQTIIRILNHDTTNLRIDTFFQIVNELGHDVILKRKRRKRKVA